MSRHSKSGFKCLAGFSGLHASRSQSLFCVIFAMGLLRASVLRQRTGAPTACLLECTDQLMPVHLQVSLCLC